MSAGIEHDGTATTLGDLVGTLEDTYPLEWAESWDRVGLVLGERSATVVRVLLAVDPTLEVAREAVETGSSLLVTHHPLLLRGASFLPADDGKGAVVTTLLRAGIGLWCGHTNVDRSTLGTVGAWIRALDLDDARPLLPPATAAGGTHGSQLFGLGVVGTLPAATTVGGLARTVSGIIPATARGVAHTGDAERTVRTVAVCPGAGDSFVDAAARAGVDAYITSDLRHHPTLEHVEAAADATAVPALVDVSHAASESLWLPLVKDVLTSAAPDVGVAVSTRSSDPWTGIAP